MNAICCDCRRPFSGNDESALELHITMDHLDWFPYECRRCSYVRLPTEATLLQHFAEAHPEEDVTVRTFFGSVDTGNSLQNTHRWNCEEIPKFLKALEFPFMVKCDLKVPSYFSEMSKIASFYQSLVNISKA